MSLAVPVGPEDHIQGPENAPLTLVEYADYECPYCGDAHVVVKRLQDELGPRLRFVFRNFPLTQVHPHAQLAAEAAEAAGAQNRFWEMHERLYENQAALSPELIGAVAHGLGLDMERFEKDLASGQFRERVERDFMGGIRSGVPGTPTFFINGERHDGAPDEVSLLGALQAAA
jgi:protein-disulfide isomerase